MTELVAEGGCYCGDIRIRATGRPFYVSYCHCNDCRRLTGVPVTVFVGYRKGQMEMRGVPKFYHSSPGVRRSFCPGCGTPLSYEDGRLPGEIYFTVGVFDETERFEPGLHGWTSQSLGWLHLDDGLPRYKETSRPRQPAPGTAKPEDCRTP